MIKYANDNNEKDNANSQLANGHLTNGQFVLPLVKQYLRDDAQKINFYWKQEWWNNREW